MKKNQNSKERIKKLKIYTMVGYSLIIILVMTTVSFLTINKTDEVLKSKVSSMISALNVQMKMNINSYLSRMETTSTFVFAADEVYEYDATDENNDEYEALQTEEIINQELYSICIMENYVDFGIVYSNNHTVGKMSNGTIKLFGDKLYNDLSSIINRYRTTDGWSTGYNNDYTRIYYVKRINNNALLVTSFYTTELEDVFEHPGGIKDINIHLVEKNYAVIYSSEGDETGKKLSQDIYTRIQNQTAMTIMDDKYLITVNDCGDNWYVVCSVPTKIILNEKNEVTYYIYIIVIIASIISIITGIFLLQRIITPVSSMVTNLDNKAHLDLLTGVLNKRSFEENIELYFKIKQKDKFGALIILDVDNFKGVNDTLGHAYGDKVLIEIGNILRSIFSADDYLGRLGGDEFCVFLSIPDSKQEIYMDYIKSKCSEICTAFNDNYMGDDGNYKISVSIGAAIFPTHGRDFQAIYQFADDALYASKHKGKDTYTIFDNQTKRR